MDVGEYPAGAALDALVAARVGVPVLPYSTDLDAIWQLINYLYETPKPVGYSVELYLSNRYRGPWRAEIIGPSYEYSVHGVGFAATAPLAICRALLQAIKTRGFPKLDKGA